MKTLTIKVPEWLWYVFTDPLYWSIEGVAVVYLIIQWLGGYQNNYVEASIGFAFLIYTFALVWKRRWREVKTTNATETISEE